MKNDVKNIVQDNIKQLLDSLAEGVLIINEATEIVFINRRITTLFGYQKEELEGKKLSVLLPERFKNIHDQHLQKYFTHPVIRPMGSGMELEGIKKDGTEFFLEISLSFLNEDNTKLGFAFISDITARHNAEEELRERNKELDSFAHTVAHDMNSTLAAVVGFGELLQKFPELPKEKKEIYYDRIVSSGRKLSSIIRELLFFASIKKEEVSRQKVNMKDIIQEAVKRLSGIIADKKVKLIIRDEIENANTYGPWIEEIWYNLISNAIKYGGNPPQIEIGHQAQDGYIKYWVKDNGKGLTEEEKNTILEDNVKFRNKNIKGHGLGLSIVHRILKKLDGYLDVEIQPKKGSTFVFYLPR